MNLRSRITLGIRLVGLASVLWGVYSLIGVIEVATSPALDSVRDMAKGTPVEGMFNSDAFRPSYIGPILWTGTGLLLMAISARLTRFLFSGLEPGEPGRSSEARPTS